MRIGTWARVYMFVSVYIGMYMFSYGCVYVSTNVYMHVGIDTYLCVRGFGCVNECVRV